ncbi:hypothetical protein [Paracidovorax cattleyae]|uniref:hypothetical protein n=1 Tax=Paracidovorax cattleyae TaxID=80868 RepID=UPI0018AF6838|nr:hypothetical protein [Paracidovorax cattleyae]MBF9263395.1 hypothetical protein [Paracidovorax cattleyae]
MAVRVSISLKPTITCPATLYLPGDNGEHVKVDFAVLFKRQKTEERNGLNDRYVKGELTMPQLLDEVVVGWDGFRDEQGQPVPYSHEMRVATDNEYPGLEQAMAVSWFDHAFINQRDAAVKNSKAQSGTTSALTTPSATS